MTVHNCEEDIVAWSGRVGCVSLHDLLGMCILYRVIRRQRGVGVVPDDPIWARSRLRRGSLPEASINLVDRQKRESFGGHPDLSVGLADPYGQLKGL